MLVKCPVCNGKGEYQYYSDTIKETYPVKCTVCAGTGKVERSYVARLAAKRRKKKVAL